MGADIEGIGTSVLTIHGVKQLRGTEHTVISDDIEAGTFIVAGAITRGDVYVKGITSQQIPAISEKLTEAGVELDWDNNGVRVTTPREIRGIDVTTEPFPGFPTDMQAQIMGTALPRIWDQRYHRKCTHRSLHPCSRIEPDGRGHHARW